MTRLLTAFSAVLVAFLLGGCGEDGKLNSPPDQPAPVAEKILLPYETGEYRKLWSPDDEKDGEIFLLDWLLSQGFPNSETAGAEVTRTEVLQVELLLTVTSETGYSEDTTYLLAYYVSAGYWVTGSTQVKPAFIVGGIGDSYYAEYPPAGIQFHLGSGTMPLESNIFTDYTTSETELYRTPFCGVVDCGYIQLIGKSTNNQHISLAGLDSFAVLPWQFAKEEAATIERVGDYKEYSRTKCLAKERSCSFE